MMEMNDFWRKNSIQENCEKSRDFAVKIQENCEKSWDFAVKIQENSSQHLAGMHTTPQCTAPHH